MDKNQFLMKQGLKVVARMEVRDRRQATLFHLRFAWDTLLQTSGGGQIIMAISAKKYCKQC
jgi:hypothetical protein